MRIAAVIRDTWSVYEYESDDGEPVLADVKASDLPGCVAFLERVAANGPSWLPENRSHHVSTDEPKIWQFNVTGTLRLLWFYDEGRMVVLGSCFYKQGGKKGTTPQRLVRKAQTLHERYFEAKRNGKLEIK